MRLSFELLLPNKRLYHSPRVDLVTIPGLEGYFGVMVGHAPLIASMRPGLIEVSKSGDNSSSKDMDRFLVGFGFAEALPVRCKAMTDMGISFQEFDKSANLERIGELKDLIEGAFDEESEKARKEMSTRMVWSEIENRLNN